MGIAVGVSASFLEKSVILFRLDWTEHVQGGV